MKRSHDESADNSHSHKKHKHRHHHHHRSKEHSYAEHERDNRDYKLDEKESQRPSYEDALQQLPPPTSKSGYVTAYTHFTIPANTLPPLPPVHSAQLSAASFKHKSTTSYNRSSSLSDLTYERLEFLGDAYIELIASRLLFERYVNLPAGQQSQLRELLVKNETLAEYSRAYGFDKKVEVGTMEDGKQKGNKGFNKVLGDVFEAYVAAVILSDVEDGFAVAEKWLTALWAPKLVAAGRNSANWRPQTPLTHPSSSPTADLLTIYNPAAKSELQKRILAPHDVKLSYEAYKDTVELKGDQLGQNRHYIALYLIGYGYERKLLGKGEGRNKVEAGNWAATEAMHGECKGLVEECEKKWQRMKEEKAAVKEEKAAAKARSREQSGEK